jgi:hypothetical protein
MIEYRIATSSSRNHHPGPKAWKTKSLHLSRRGYIPHDNPFVFKEAICQAMVKPETPFKSSLTE